MHTEKKRELLWVPGVFLQGLTRKISDLEDLANKEAAASSSYYLQSLLAHSSISELDNSSGLSLMPEGMLNPPPVRLPKLVLSWV